ncbi:unnamed protein product [Caenorhabditis auriculariae]|uniref:Shugoshin C-terminal domain-containing protein n=1 Tax=Caenorhabditis auriculariae TaxID=2777116 RepID=A0A8S1GSL4_9PELO|nr:unnamed protein product [Caenorhabditis auriculariae]
MSKSLSREALISIFGKKKETGQNVPSTSSKPDENDDYKKSNGSLVMKILQLKNENAQNRKTMDKLRAENEELREINRSLSAANEEERIEMIVAQRVKTKMAHLNAMNQRTISFLQSMTSDYQDAMKDFKELEGITVQPAKPSRVRSQLAVPTSLSSVDEAPLVPLKRVPLKILPLENEVRSLVEEQDDDVTPTVSPVKRDAAVTQRRKPRSSGKKSETPPKTVRRGVKSDSAALKVISNNNALETPQRHPARVQKNRSDSEGFVVPATPTAPADFDGDSQTVRRKRAAAAKVTSMAEPKLSGKLRRPGKYDEPVPFISNYLY